MEKLHRGIVAALLLAAVGLTGCIPTGTSAKLQQDAIEQAAHCITPPSGASDFGGSQPRYSWIACYQ